MTAEEKKARELVEKWGIDGAYQISKDNHWNAFWSEDKEEKLYLWQSVREHILKLKNEGK